MSSRREFITLLSGAVGWPLAARAQRAQKTPIVGFLHPGSPEGGSIVLDSLREGFREVGYVLVPTARPSIEAARAATSTLPIVANDLESDPIASGYVASLARPGGNLTGVFLDAPTLCSKWLQYIDDVVPNVTKVGVLWDVTTGTFQLDAVTVAAKTKSLRLMVMQFRNAAELEPAFNRGLNDNPEAIVQLGSPLIRQGAPRIAEILSSRRIPAISQFRTYPDGGGLMSYGPDLSHLYRRVSSQVCRSNGRPSSSWLSTSRPPRRSALGCRTRCSLRPMRSSNDPAAGVHHAARRRGGCVAARGARAAAMPVIAFLGSGASLMAPRLHAFRLGLKDIGYVKART